MSELIENLRASFADEDYRNSYVESFMNSYVAAQIKTLREDNDLTQEKLATMIGTKQAGISRLENVNYSAWKVETLRKLARAFKLRLRITFEEFGTLPIEIEGFNRASLARRPFDKDPVFAATLSLGSVDTQKETEAHTEIGYIFGKKRSSGAAAQADEEKRYASA